VKKLRLCLQIFVKRATGGLTYFLKITILCSIIENELFIINYESEFSK